MVHRRGVSGTWKRSRWRHGEVFLHSQGVWIVKRREEPWKEEPQAWRDGIQCRRPKRQRRAFRHTGFTLRWIKKQICPNRLYACPGASVWTFSLLPVCASLLPAGAIISARWWRSPPGCHTRPALVASLMMLMMLGLWRRDGMRDRLVVEFGVALASRLSRLQPF